MRILEIGEKVNEKWCRMEVLRTSGQLLCYLTLNMPKPRGREHSTLTETATLVVHELVKIPGIKMIAPGEIRTNSRGASGRFVTCVYTNAGFELIISGQSAQKVAVHTTSDPKIIFTELKASKKLRDFTFKDRERKPGTR